MSDNGEVNMAGKTGAAGAVVKKEADKLPALDYGEDDGAGFEGQDSSYIAIPFINVLQALSPAVKPPEQGGVPDAKVGMLMNSVTQDLYPKGIELVICHTDHVIVEWVPREKGGGFVGVHQMNDEIVEKARQKIGPDKKLLTPDGNHLVETFHAYGVMVEDGAVVGMAVVAFSSTKIKSFRGWNTKINMFAHRKHGIPGKPPLWAHRVKIATAFQKNNKGEFYVTTVEPAVDNDVFKSLLPPSSDIYAAAKQARDMVLDGNAKAAFETAEQSGVADGENAKGDAEIPF